MNLSYEDYAEWFRIRFKKEPSPEEEARLEKLSNRLPLDNDINTSLASYVWLPLSFDGENFTLSWQEKWSI
jgi:hypothetical protein